MTTIIGLAERIGTGQGNGDTRKIDLTKEMNAGEVVIETFEGEMNPEIATAIDEMTPLTLGKSLEGMTAGIGCLTEAQWYSPVR